MKAALITFFVLLFCIGVFVSMNAGPETEQSSLVQQSQTNEAAENISTKTSISTGGELIDYTAEKLASSDAETNILFFHAPWCVVCNSVERNLQAGTVPDGYRILKVDFDSSEGQDLADTYNIPIQYTMVQVDSDGNEITQWVNQSFFTIDDVVERAQTT